FSLETERGRMMNGKTTTSFMGRTGRMSGIGRSASRSVATSLSSISAMGDLFLRLGLDGDLDLLLAQVRYARERHLEKSVPQARSGVVRVDRPRQRDRLHKGAEVALHAEEAESPPGANAHLLRASNHDDAAAD